MANICDNYLEIYIDKKHKNKFIIQFENLNDFNLYNDVKVGHERLLSIGYSTRWNYDIAILDRIKNAEGVTSFTNYYYEPGCEVCGYIKWKQGISSYEEDNEEYIQHYATDIANVVDDDYEIPLTHSIYTFLEQESFVPFKEYEQMLIDMVDIIKGVDEILYEYFIEYTTVCSFYKKKINEVIHDYIKQYEKKHKIYDSSFPEDQYDVDRDNNL